MVPLTPWRWKDIKNRRNTVLSVVIGAITCLTGGCFSLLMPRPFEPDRKFRFNPADPRTHGPVLCFESHSVLRFLQVVVVVVFVSRQECVCVPRWQRAKLKIRLWLARKRCCQRKGLLFFFFFLNLYSLSVIRALSLKCYADTHV